jgi:hypothetical protein
MVHSSNSAEQEIPGAHKVLTMSFFFRGPEQYVVRA